MTPADRYRELVQHVSSKWVSSVALCADRGQRIDGVSEEAREGADVHSRRALLRVSGVVVRPTGGVVKHSRTARVVSKTAAYLAAAATHEAEAVLAFHRTAEELRVYAAPTWLCERMLRAAQQEREHSALLGALALVYGGVPEGPRHAEQGVRPLVMVAVENAREGLVREVFGSLLLYWQALHAPSEKLRGLFEKIAVEEVQHAEDSKLLDEWLCSQLIPEDIALVEDAREVARAALLRSLPVWHPVARETLGLPDEHAAQRLLEEALREGLL